MGWNDKQTVTTVAAVSTTDAPTIEQMLNIQRDLAAKQLAMFEGIPVVELPKQFMDMLCPGRGYFMAVSEDYYARLKQMVQPSKEQP